MPPTRAARLRRLLEGRRALALIGLLALTFLVLGVLVRYSALAAFDLRVTKDLQRHEPTWVVRPLEALTFLGSPGTVPFVAALAAALMFSRRRPRGAWLALLSLLSIPLFTVLKEFWHRARPDAAIVHVAVRTSGTSFPSGHATGGTAVYGALAFLAWLHLDRRDARLPVVFTLSLLPVGIDASRVLLGAHWLSDVVGGSAVGLLLLVLLVRWYLAGLEDAATTGLKTPETPRPSGGEEGPPRDALRRAPGGEG